MESLSWRTRTMTYIIGDRVEQLFTCGFNISVCFMRKKTMLCYTYLTKDEDVKQQCVILVNDKAHMSATLASRSIFAL